MVIAFRIAADLKMNGKCRMTASRPISKTQSFSSALPKNSPYTSIVDKEYKYIAKACCYKFSKIILN